MCGKMAEELLSLKWNNHQAHFVDILTFLREQEIFVDATLACGGKLYAAHKFVLSTCSDYFKQMFTKNPSKHPIVFMKDVSTRDLEALLDFMYNGEVNVPQSSLGSLIKTAEGLQIKGLAVPDDPPAKRDRDNRDNKPQERLSPSPKRPRVRENSPVHSLPSRSLAQSSYTPTPSSSSINRPRSPLPPTNTSSGISQAPIEGTLDEDSRTSIQSGVSGLSEQNSSTTPSLSSKIGSSSQQILSNTGDINSHLEKSGTEEPSPGPSGIQKQEIKQEEIVDLGEDDEGDWGAEGDAGGGDSSMGSENPPSFPDVILPHGSDAMQGHTGDPAMTMRLILGELGEAGGGASTLLPEGSGGSSSNNIPLVRRGTVSASSSTTGDVQHTHTAQDYDILEYCLSDSMTDQLPGEHPRSPPHGLHHSSSTGRLQGAQTSGDHQLVTGALLYQSRPYACPYCAKRFKRKDHLVEHERTHTGERPYVCRECGKSFAKKTNLNTHVRSHHIQRQHHVQPGPLDLKSNSISP